MLMSFYRTILSSFKPALILFVALSLSACFGGSEEEAPVEENNQEQQEQRDLENRDFQSIQLLQLIPAEGKPGDTVVVVGKGIEQDACEFYFKGRQAYRDPTPNVNLSALQHQTQQALALNVPGGLFGAQQTVQVVAKCRNEETAPLNFVVLASTNGGGNEPSGAPVSCTDDTECAAGEFCDNGTCEPIPVRTCIDAGDCNQGEACLNGVCAADPCDSLSCGTGEICDSGFGRCVDDPTTNVCGTGSCNPGEICDDGSCTADPCNSVSCGAGEICDSSNGLCVDDPTTNSCGVSVCNPGEVCDNGTCAVDLCSGVSCGNGELCEVASGNCIDDPTTDACGNSTCQAGEICQSGVCVGPDPCLGVVCAANEVCDEGSCIVDPCVSDPTDDDGDGVCNAVDSCNGSDDTLDADGDAIPDGCDVCPNDNPNDSDGDGVCESQDTCPGGNDNLDDDNDTVCNALDVCTNGDDTVDTDGDGIPDDCDVCNSGPNDQDADGDGVADACDPCPNSNPDDADGDGVCDLNGSCIGDPTSGDQDNDGYCDNNDNCIAIPSNDQTDTDGDGVGDICDVCPLDAADDSDGDGSCDSDDLCIGFDDNVDGDGDGLPDACDDCPVDNPNDSDGDTVCDSLDLCPGNDDTADFDNDGTPDACDTCPLDAADDSDNDGSCDTNDICLGHDDNVDADGDGVPDGCDQCPGFNDAADFDGDGAPDDCDVCPLSNPNDADGDGWCDDQAPCIGDPELNGTYVDSDGDGYCDTFDNCITHGNSDQADVDGDGVGDVCDICPNDSPDDSDGDGSCDSLDICPDHDDTLDADGDGVPNGCDQCAGSDDNQDVNGNGTPDGCEVVDCSMISCGTGEICDPVFRACVDDPSTDACGSVTCQPDEVCDEGNCVANPCDNITCGNGEQCSNGICVDDPSTDVCGAITCQPGEVCDEGNCVDNSYTPDDCEGVICGSGELCVAGQCAAESGTMCIDDSGCPEGESCDNGNCRASGNPCDTITCMVDQVCNLSTAFCEPEPAPAGSVLSFTCDPTTVYLHQSHQGAFADVTLNWEFSGHVDAFTVSEVDGAIIYSSNDPQTAATSVGSLVPAVDGSQPEFEISLNGGQQTMQVTCSVVAVGCEDYGVTIPAEQTNQVLSPTNGYQVLDAELSWDRTVNNGTLGYDNTCFEITDTDTNTVVDTQCFGAGQEAGTHIFAPTAGSTYEVSSWVENNTDRYCESDQLIVSQFVEPEATLVSVSPVYDHDPRLPLHLRTGAGLPTDILEVRYTVTSGFQARLYATAPFALTIDDLDNGITFSDDNDTYAPSLVMSQHAQSNTDLHTYFTSGDPLHWIDINMAALPGPSGITLDADGFIDGTLFIRGSIDHINTVALGVTGQAAVGNVGDTVHNVHQYSEMSYNFSFDIDTFNATLEAIDSIDNARLVEIRTEGCLGWDDEWRIWSQQPGTTQYVTPFTCDYDGVPLIEVRVTPVIGEPEVIDYTVAMDPAGFQLQLDCERVLDPGTGIEHCRVNGEPGGSVPSEGTVILNWQITGYTPGTPFPLKGIRLESDRLCNERIAEVQGGGGQIVGMFNPCLTMFGAAPDPLRKMVNFRDIWDGEGDPQGQIEVNWAHWDGSSAEEFFFSLQIQGQLKALNGQLGIRSYQSRFDFLNWPTW